MTKEKLDDNELMNLVHKWQNAPQKYNSLIIEQVYPTLLEICKKQKESAFNKEQVNASVHSLVNEAYIRLQQTQCQTPVESLREFNLLLGGIVRSILLDRYKKTRRIKRNGIPTSSPLNDVTLKDGFFDSKFKANILQLDEGLTKLKNIEPDAAEALSLRVYNAKTNAQTAFIMNKSLSTIERLVTEGRKILNALIHGVEISV